MATIFMPHIAADAGLVPWAETGMRHTSGASSRGSVVGADERITAYSPEPALGCRDMASKPVISHECLSRRAEHLCVASLDLSARRGECSQARPGDRDHLVVALSFIVHEPRAIME